MNIHDKDDFAKQWNKMDMAGTPKPERGKLERLFTPEEIRRFEDKLDAPESGDRESESYWAVVDGELKQLGGKDDAA